MNKLSAYLHVPFCRRKCAYCDFYSAPPADGAVSSYAKALAAQIRSSPQKGRALYTVYLGGGTPSLLSPDDFALIASSLRETFDLSACAEFTVECNPESVSPALVDRWLSYGVDRVSMGIQTFSDASLARLGRLHTAARAKEAYGKLRRCGVEKISLDLMAALPDQTGSDLEFDLNSMIALSPEHVSVYLLKIEPRTALGRAGVAEADEDLQREMYLTTHRRLTAAGFEHYEISNFAKPGFRALHNSHYWQGGEYLAFGPNASGFVDDVRFRIPADTAAFCAANGQVTPIVEEIVDREEGAREKILLGLRCSDGIPVSALSPEKQPLLQPLCRAGLATLSDDRFALTAEGFLVSDAVISQLMPE